MGRRLRLRWLLGMCRRRLEAAEERNGTESSAWRERGSAWERSRLAAGVTRLTARYGGPFHFGARRGPRLAEETTGATGWR